MAAPKKENAQPAQGQFAQVVFAGVAGLFLFIAILKFGTPIILDFRVEPSDSFVAAVFESWQIKWGFWLMLPLVVSGLVAMRWKSLKFRWWLALPLAWLGWQFLSATQSVDHKLSDLLLKDFSVCVVLFYLGHFGLQGVRNPWLLWAGLGLALCWVMRMGLEQHFGGLEATRRMVYQMKDSADLSAGNLSDPNFQRRIASSRIFSTFSNADAMAGCIELLLPLTLVFLWQITPKVRRTVRWAFVAIMGGVGLACLYWTGSKGGWLVTLIMGVIALRRSGLEAKWKRILICGILIIGGLTFAARYASSYQKQTVSFSSRFSYWKAALEITATHPVFGTGPGTFGVLYGPMLKLHNSGGDFARLCHNDYLEQACDSGMPGFIVYTGMIGGYLLILYRYRRKDSVLTPGFCVWLGVLGVCLHSVVEYHLYVPALAWPMFFLMGFALNSKD